MIGFSIFIVCLILTILLAAAKNATERSVIFFGIMTLLLFPVGVSCLCSYFAGHDGKWSTDTFWMLFWIFGFLSCIADVGVTGNPFGTLIAGIINFFLGFMFMYVWYIAFSGAVCKGFYNLCGIFGWMFGFAFFTAVDFGLFALTYIALDVFLSIKMPLFISDVVIFLFHLYFMIFVRCFGAAS